MADLARNAPNRTFSSTVPRPMPATRPGPSPPPRRHPARPRRRAERPDTRCGPEVALTPPARGAAAPNLANLVVSCPVTTRPVRRAGALSHPLARKCAPGTSKVPTSITLVLIRSWIRRSSSRAAVDAIDLTVTTIAWPRPINSYSYGRPRVMSRYDRPPELMAQQGVN